MIAAGFFSLLAFMALLLLVELVDLLLLPGFIALLKDWME